MREMLETKNPDAMKAKLEVKPIVPFRSIYPDICFYFFILGWNIRLAR